MYRYCSNCDDAVRHLVYVEGEGNCCTSCAEYFGTKNDDDDDFDDLSVEPVIHEPQTYSALAEMQGRNL